MTGLEPLLAAGAMAAAETAGVATAAGAAAGATAAAAGTGMSLGTLSTIAGIGGSILSGVGAIHNANATAEAQRAEAANLEAQAKETRAAAQHNAERKRRETELVLSRQQAVAASSGGAATDTTVQDLMATTAGEGQLQSDTINYEGTTRGAGMNFQAALKRKAADNAVTAGYISAGSSLLSGLNQWGRYRKGYYAPSYADA